MKTETKTRELPLARLNDIRSLALEARSIGARKPVRPEVLSRQFWRAIVGTHAGQSLLKDQRSGSWLAEMPIDVQRYFWGIYFRSDLATAIAAIRNLRKPEPGAIDIPTTVQPRVRRRRTVESDSLQVRRQSDSQYFVLVSGRWWEVKSTTEKPSHCCISIVEGTIVSVALGGSVAYAVRNANEKNKVRVFCGKLNHKVHPIVFGEG